MDHLPKEFNWKCTTAKRDSKKRRAKGGIVTATRKQMVEVEIEKEEQEGFQERKIITNGKVWRIIVKYNPEGSDKILKKLD